MHGVVLSIEWPAAPVLVPLCLCLVIGHAELVGILISAAGGAAPLRRSGLRRCAPAHACNLRAVSSPTWAVPAGGALLLQACAASCHRHPLSGRQGRLCS